MGTSVANPSHTLIFGGITMVSDGAEVPDANGCIYKVKSQDTTFGNPAPVTVALLSLMRAGSLVSWDRTDNREPVLRVTLDADDSDVLARGEKALQAECEKANTLTWIPPDGAGEPSVFDIVWSQLELLFDADAEVLVRQRTYLVHLVALPSAHPVDTVVTPAAPASPTYTMVDDGTALSGSGFAWSTDVGSPLTLSVVSGRIRATRSSGQWGSITTMYRDGSVTVAAGDYLTIDFASSNLSVTDVRMASSMVGFPATGVVAREDVGGGVTRFYYGPFATAATFPNINIKPTGNVPNTAAASYFELDQVRKASAIPNIGSARQKALSLVPGGAVRTQGSIQVSHATSALGKTIVYTHPSGTGYLPPLSPWRTSGDARSADSTLLSGNKATLTGVTTWRVPVSALPTGRVEVWAWLSASATTTFTLNWSLFSYMGSTALSSDNYTKSMSLPTTWGLFFLGAVTMPPVDIGPAGYVAVQMQASGGGTPAVSWDEVYLFATDLGSLTVVDCATGSPTAGGPSNRLWIDAPSPALPQGAIYRGNAADRSDQWHAGTPSTVWGDHDFDPEGTNVFVATQNALDAATSLEHYRRYHTHVARET